MLTIEQIESAILQLSPEDVQKLFKWISDLNDQLWDQELEQDLALGKLDNLITKVETDITKGQVRDLHEVLHNSLIN